MAIHETKGSLRITESGEKGSGFTWTTYEYDLEFCRDGNDVVIEADLIEDDYERRRHMSHKFKVSVAQLRKLLDEAVGP